MNAKDLNAILEYLELNDEQAGTAFGIDPAEVNLMRHGALAIPFIVSAMIVLMSESAKATRLTLEHGAAMKLGDASLKDLLADATGISVGTRLPAMRTPKLTLVQKND